MNYIKALSHLKNGDKMTLDEWVTSNEIKYIEQVKDSSAIDFKTIRLVSKIDGKFNYSHLFTDIDLMITGNYKILI